MAGESGRLLAEGLAAMSLELDTATQSQLLEYLRLLAKWNRTYNLTAVRQPEQMVMKHLLDSLSILPYLQGPRILDVGTGPGLPGIPLSLACPAWHFCLLDSNGKKTRFVAQAVSELGIKNADVVQSRVEDFRPPERFNTITARAFASIAVILDSTRHLVAEDGRFLLMKGTYPAAELEALPNGFVLEAAQPLTVPGLEAERHVLIIKKTPEDQDSGASTGAKRE